MPTFRVWAPNAQTVELKTAQKKIPMGAKQGGWWSVDDPQAQPETDYQFVLDGGQPLPDPRSPWQPQGVHGPSRTVDPTSFQWTDQRFQPTPLPAAVIYELHIGAFTPEGTFESAISRLDGLARLGVTHIELMPVAEFPGSSGWGYDGVDLYAPHHAYGGPQGLKRLVNAAHEKGLAVLLDVVYNHLGPDGNYLSRYGPYYTDRHHTPWGQAVNMDGVGSDEVRRFFIDNALMWLRDYHIDGLRLDAVHAIVDTSAIHFLEQLAGEVDVLETQLGRYLVLIAESDLNNPRIVQRPEVGGYGIDALWNDDFHHALHTVLTQEHSGYYADFGSLSQLAKALQQVYVYDGVYSTFRGRVHGRQVLQLPRCRFLAYAQNHDQVGNRAQGERLSHLVDIGLLKVAAAVVLTSPYIPMLFMGEEWGASTPFQYFTDHQDPLLAEQVSEGRRKVFSDFGWSPADVPDPQAPETAQASKLLWDEGSQEPHASLLKWHQQLIALRRELPTLSDTRLDGLQTEFGESERWMVIERGPLRIVLNLAEYEQIVPLIASQVERVFLASADSIEIYDEGLRMPAHSAAILRV